MRSILILILFLTNQLDAQVGSDAPVSDCFDDTIAATSSNTGDYKLAYTVSVPRNERCFHGFIYAFYITYTLGDGDANSNFALTYFQMQIDANGNCEVDPLGSTGTISTATKYTTITDTGASTTPCGYYVYLSYTSTNVARTVGVFNVLSDFGSMLLWAPFLVFFSYL